jgi:DNA repair ATPase RecN
MKMKEEHDIAYAQWLKALKNGNTVDEEKFRKLLIETNRTDTELQEIEKALGIWTQKDEAEFRRLNAKRMKAYRDKKRTRKYSPRPSRLLSSSKTVLKA